MIDRSTVEHILDSSNIVDVIQEFVSLKKRGTNHIGLCPFHDEKTPSFTVSLSKGIYKCFGCGKAGNVTNFLMEHENLSYPDALRYLARKYNIEIIEKEQSPEDFQRKNELESLMIVCSFAQKYFSNVLHKRNEGRTIGLTYLTERGIREDIIEKFQLGYCPDNFDGFTKDAIKEGYKPEFLVKSGLSIDSNNQLFDRFRGRIIFPIQNIAGRVIGFTGRTLKSGDKKIAKYVNSPDSPAYHKGDVLYGLFFAKQAITKKDKCYIVEGNTDVIAMHQAGIENVVATSGTALTVHQLKIIKRFSHNVTMVFDGDEAGIKASLRGIDLVLEEGLQVRIIMLPENEDPDSFSKKHNSSSLLAYFGSNEMDFIQFKTNLLLKGTGNDPVKRAQVAGDIVRSISMIPDSIMRSEYIKECSKTLNIEERVLYTEIRKIFIRRSQLSQESRFVKTDQQDTSLPPLPGFIDEVFCEAQEKEIIYFLMNYGNNILILDNQEAGEKEEIIAAKFIIREIQNDELKFKNLIYKAIFQEYYELLEQDIHIGPKKFIHHENAEIRELAANILSRSYQLSPRWEKSGNLQESEESQLEKSIQKSLIVYKSKVLLQAEKDMQKDLKELVQVNDEAGIADMLEKMNAVKRSQTELSKTLERIIL